MLIFKPIDCFPKGTIFNLLSDSYLDFHNNYPEYLSENTKSFSECDTFFYEKIIHPRKRLFVLRQRTTWFSYR